MIKIEPANTIKSVIQCDYKYNIETNIFIDTKNIDLNKAVTDYDPIKHISDKYKNIIASYINKHIAIKITYDIKSAIVKENDTYNIYIRNIPYKIIIPEENIITEYKEEILTNTKKPTYFAIINNKLLKLKIICIQ